MISIDRLRRPAIACAIGLLIGTSAATAAEDASRWDGDVRSAVRLIAGSQPAGAAIIRAGIEFKLKPGWHTYWRYPGDAGVPPRFDFQGSRNVKAVEVLWPAPQRIPEAGMIAIGYTSSLVLPLQITPQDPGKPVTLRLKLDYAVCEKLCVPAEAKVELVVAGRTSSHEAALAAAEARVPRKVALGEGSERSPSARSDATTAPCRRAFSSTSPGLPAPICSPRGRRRNGRCRCRPSWPGRRRLCIGLPSRPTARRRAPSSKARNSGSRRSPDRRRSRS